MQHESIPMTDVPFHVTRMGARFYEHTLPELVRQIERLNRNLERLAEAATRDNPHLQGEPHDEEQDDAPDRRHE